MKNLIRKILKEEQDEFEWARGFDTSEVEKQIFKPFRDVEYEYNFDGPQIYNLLVDAGIKDIDKLKEIGEEIYDQVRSVYNDGRDSGYESGRDDCDCDGCCDDYVYYEDVDMEKEEAREEGYENGYNTAKSEMESEIEDLKSIIEDLESRLNESTNQKNIKRI